MKPKRGETATQTIDRWANELLASTTSNKDYDAEDYNRALEYVSWLKARLEVLKVHNT